MIIMRFNIHQLSSGQKRNQGLTEAELRDGDVIENDAEVIGSVCQLFPDHQTHLK